MSLITSGWLAKPAGTKIRLRRSTIALLVAFFGFGALYMQIRTEDEVDQPDVVIVTPTTVTTTTIATISP